MRKLRRTAETTVLVVELRAQLIACLREDLRVRRRRLRGLDYVEPGEELAQSIVLFGDRAALLAICRGHALYHVDEPRHPITRALRKIRAGEERHEIVWREKYRQRPAAGTLREILVRGLVNLVEIRAFFAVNFYAYEVLVHGARGFRVLERFMRHHVAP